MNNDENNYDGDDYDNVLNADSSRKNDSAKSDQVSEFSSSRHCRSDRTSCAPGKNVKQSKYNEHCDDKHKGHCGKTW